MKARNFRPAVFALVALTLLLSPITSAVGAQAKNAFGLNSPNVSGFPTGVVRRGI